MKHATLSAFLLVGLGLTTGLAFFGGGDVHYAPEMGGTEIQQSAGNASEKGTQDDATGSATRQKIAENQRIHWCAGDEGSTCAACAVKPAK